MGAWESMDVPAMWEALQPHSTSEAYRHLHAWQRMQQLCDEHASRIAVYRDRLAMAWPPETNSAAEAFDRRLDHLVRAMREGASAAAGNAAAVVGVAESIEVARNKAAALHIEWQKRMAGHGPVKVGPGPSPDAPWAQDLNRRARQVMAEMDTAVEQYGQRMAPPKSASPVYDSGTYAYLTEWPEGQAADGAASTPQPAVATGTGTTASSVLAGAVGAAVGVADGPGSSGIATPGPMAPAGVVSSQSPFGVAPFGGTSATRPGTAVQPGGVIGGSGAGGRSAAPSSVRSVMPPGGVIAGVSGRGATAGGEFGTERGAPLGAMGRGASGGRSDNRRWSDEPDGATEVWTVREGVPPVIERAPDPDHFDPGPGVWGIDR